MCKTNSLTRPHDMEPAKIQISMFCLIRVFTVCTTYLQINQYILYSKALMYHLIKGHGI